MSYTEELKKSLIETLQIGIDYDESLSEEYVEILERMQKHIGEFK